MISDNDIGLYVTYEALVYNNNFVNNAIQANGNNADFDNTDDNIASNNSGNYWSDWSTICDDTNNDNLCDDYYPFTNMGIYDNYVWNVIKNLKPSDRGELEITDVNNWYVKNGLMKFKKLNGFWSDAGTPDSLAHATQLVKELSDEIF